MRGWCHCFIPSAPIPLFPATVWRPRRWAACGFRLPPLLPLLHLPARLWLDQPPPLLLLVLHAAPLLHMCPRLLSISPIVCLRLRRRVLLVLQATRVLLAM